MIRLDLSLDAPGFRLAAQASWEASSAALFGASGSGKTTIVEAIAGVRRDVRGSVVVDGDEMSALSPERRGVGWAPQEAPLFPHMTARANVEFGGRGPHVARAVEALELGPLLHRRATDLSGGERQRVALARAVARRPRLLLLDEALSAVDRPLRARVVGWLAGLPEELGCRTIAVSHDPHEVLALARHVVVLDRGAVVAQGDPRDILASPAAIGVLEALHSENLFRVAAKGRRPGVVDLCTEGGTALAMASVPGVPEPERVAVGANDIILATGEIGAVSAQNVLPGVVAGIEPLGTHVYVRVRVGGEVWVAKVTERAVERLGLRAGAGVTMLVKAHAVRGY